MNEKPKLRYGYNAATDAYEFRLGDNLLAAYSNAKRQLDPADYREWLAMSLLSLPVEMVADLFEQEEAADE